MVVISRQAAKTHRRCAFTAHQSPIGIDTSRPAPRRWSRSRRRLATSLAISIGVHSSSLALAWWLGAANFMARPLEVAQGRYSIALMASLATPETSTQEKPHEPSAAITADQVRRAATQQPIGSPQPSIEPVARRPNTDLPKPDMLAALPDVLPCSEVSLVEVQPVIEPGGARDGDAILAQGPQATNDSDTPRKQKAAEIDSTASIPSPASAASAGADNAQPARIVFNPAPAYPPEALAARQTGRVVVRVTVTVEGTVKQARLHRSSGIASLDAAALAAVRNWRFQPAMLDGLRVERDLAVPVRFTLAAQ